MSEPKSVEEIDAALRQVWPELASTIKARRDIAVRRIDQLLEQRHALTVAGISEPEANPS